MSHFGSLFVLCLVCQIKIGGQGGRGGDENEGGEGGSAYDNGPSGGLLPGSGGGKGAGFCDSFNQAGVGGAGGGAILLYSEEIIINGVITVNGINGGNPLVGSSTTDWSV